jgi:hypothetical protein
MRSLWKCLYERNAEGLSQSSDKKGEETAAGEAKWFVFPRKLATRGSSKRSSAATFEKKTSH